MSWVLVYWVVVAAIGTAYAGLGLLQSFALDRYLPRAAYLPAPKSKMIKANRLELARDFFLVLSLGVNLFIGAIAAIAGWLPGIKPVSGYAALVGFLITATLLAVYAVLNYWARNR